MLCFIKKKKGEEIYKAHCKAHFVMVQFRLCIRIQHLILWPPSKTKLFLNFSEGKSGSSKYMQALTSHGKSTTTWAVNDLMTSWLT